MAVSRVLVFHKHILFIYILIFLNSLPHNKILDNQNWKHLQTTNINFAEMMISVCDMVENIVWNGENASYKHFLLFLQCFQKLTSLGSLKLWIVWKRAKNRQNPSISLVEWSLDTLVKNI